MLNPYMSYSLNSLKGDTIGTIGLIKGDTRSLDYSSFSPNMSPLEQKWLRDDAVLEAEDVRDGVPALGKSSSYNGV